MRCDYLRYDSSVVSKAIGEVAEHNFGYEASIVSEVLGEYLEQVKLLVYTSRIAGQCGGEPAHVHTQCSSSRKIYTETK